MLLHEPPLAFEILGNVIVARGKYLLDGHVDPQVQAYGVCEHQIEGTGHQRTLVDVPKGTGSQFLPIPPDILGAGA